MQAHTTTSRNIPVQTTKLVKRIAKRFPKTPFLASEAISKYFEKNYLYGADENIIQKRWSRFPHEITKFMNCNDSGIFNFLLADAVGLDTILVRFENFDGLDQSHLGALVRGSTSDYFLSNNDFGKIVINKNHILLDNKKVKFGDITLIDKPRLTEYVEDIASQSIKAFLEPGQLLSYKYHVKEKNLSLIYEVTTFMKIVGNYFEVRKSYGLPGVYVHSIVNSKKLELVVSSGFNNGTLINPFPVIQIKENETKEIKYDKKTQRRLQRAFNKWMYKNSMFHTIQELKPELINNYVEEVGYYDFNSAKSKLAFAVRLIPKPYEITRMNKSFAKDNKENNINQIYENLIVQCTKANKKAPYYNSERKVIRKAARLARKEGINVSPLIFGKIN